MISAIQNKCLTKFKKPCKEYDFYLTRFKNNIGILRCKHTQKENAIKLLSSIKKIRNEKISIESIATSGTIKSLIKKHLKNNSLK